MSALVEQGFRLGPLSLRILAEAGPEPSLEGCRDPARIPFWRVVWPSAPVLARWIVERGGWEGLPVLELGCGAGLAGLAAAAMGGRVTQTDLFPEAAALARGNARRNGLLSSTRHLAADWRHWPLRGRWPVVLASDVLYERSAHGLLLAALARSLAAGGTVYLAEPPRSMGQAFFDRAITDGWRVVIRSEQAESGIRILAMEQG